MIAIKSYQQNRPRKRLALEVEVALRKMINGKGAGKSRYSKLQAYSSIIFINVIFLKKGTIKYIKNYTPSCLL